MTNESISGFLNSIAEAKRAFDAEPEYQSRIKHLEQQMTGLGQTVASRELRIHELKQTEESLIAKLRSVEAERDDAGFRALVEGEKVSGLLVAVRTFVTEGLKCISAVEGIEQIVIGKNDYDAIIKDRDAQSFRASDLEQEVNGLKADMALAQEQLTRPFAPSGDTSSSQGEGTDPWYADATHTRVQSETVPTASVSDPILPALGNESVTDPTATTTQTAQSTSVPSVASQDTASITTSASAEGQSDGPFASQAQSQPESQIVGSDTVTNVESAVSSASQTPPERNRDRSTFFTNRKYYDVTYFVPLHQWLAEGGTEADYNWRPPVLFPQANRASHNS